MVMDRLISVCSKSRVFIYRFSAHLASHNDVAFLDSLNQVDYIALNCRLRVSIQNYGSWGRAVSFNEAIGGALTFDDGCSMSAKRGCPVAI